MTPRASDDIHTHGARAQRTTPPGGDTSAPAAPPGARRPRPRRRGAQPRGPPASQSEVTRPRRTTAEVMELHCRWAAPLLRCLASSGPCARARGVGARAGGQGGRRKRVEV
jgi:hypothetical protein